MANAATSHGAPRGRRVARAAAARVVDVARAPMPASTVGLLLSLPWFTLPGIITLPVPLSILLALVVLQQQAAHVTPPLQFAGRRAPLRTLLVACTAYWVFSAAYGMFNLASQHRDVLHLTVGDISFPPVAGMRIILLVVCFALFEAVRGQPWSVLQTMRWWLVGMATAVAIHLLAQGFGDDLTHRGGLFGEGNHAGMYYLVSFFVALEYHRRTRTRQAAGYLAAAVLGLLLSRSSAGVLVLGFALWLREVLRAPTLAIRLRRSLVSLAGIAIVGSAMFATGLDFGIADKLFGEELTPQTFSRIDRLMSINAAIDLFEESPVLGQGLQSYGFLSNDLLEGPLDFNYDWSFRRIANDIYAELAAETGIVGLLLFGAILAAVLRTTYRNRNDGAHNQFSGLVAMLIYWFAFPTYTVAYLWVYMGLCCRDAYALPAAGQRTRPSTAS